MNIETLSVPVELGGITRTISISRVSYTPGIWSCWHADVPVIVVFRTGNKRHTVRRPQAYQAMGRDGQPTGRFYFSREVVCNREVRVVAWADLKPGDSGWTNNDISHAK